MDEGSKALLGHLRFTHFTLVLISFSLIYFLDANGGHDFDRAKVEAAEALRLSEEIRDADIRGLLAAVSASQRSDGTQLHVASRSAPAVDELAGSLQRFEMRWRSGADTRLPVYLVGDGVAGTGFEQSGYIGASQLGSHLREHSDVLIAQSEALIETAYSLEQLEQLYDNIAHTTFVRPAPHIGSAAFVYFPGYRRFEPLSLGGGESAAAGAASVLDLQTLSDREAGLRHPESWKNVPHRSEYYLEARGAHSDTSEYKIYLPVTGWHLQVIPGTVLLQTLLGRGGPVADRFSTEFSTLSLLARDYRHEKLSGLSRRLDEAYENQPAAVSVLGLDIRLSRVTGYGLVSLLLVQFYFWLQVAELARTPGALHGARFPWIAVYDGLLARVLFVVSITALPFYAAYALYRAADTVSWPLAAALAASASLAFVTTWIYKGIIPAGTVRRTAARATDAAA